ncbi:MAG TPA: hypothetical protein GX005_03960 [Bacteroidales bacterium]|nr:hypothetical protein [Bacteroidales bacterium]
MLAIPKRNVSLIKVGFKKIVFKADNKLRKEMGDVRFFRMTANRILK